MTFVSTMGVFKAEGNSFRFGKCSNRCVFSNAFNALSGWLARECDLNCKGFFFCINKTKKVNENTFPAWWKTTKINVSTDWHHRSALAIIFAFFSLYLSIKVIVRCNRPCNWFNLSMKFSERLNHRFAFSFLFSLFFSHFRLKFDQTDGIVFIQSRSNDVHFAFLLQAMRTLHFSDPFTFSSSFSFISMNANRDTQTDSDRLLSTHTVLSVTQHERLFHCA